MTELLAGSQSVPGGANNGNIGQSKICTCGPFTFSTEVTVEAIEFYTASTNESTELKVGVYPDNGSETGPSTTEAGKAEATITGTAKTAGFFKVTGLSIKLPAGKYWFAFDGVSAKGTPVVAKLVTGGTGKVFKNTTGSPTTLTAQGGGWTEVNSTGPFGFAILGTKASSSGPAFTASVETVDEVKATFKGINAALFSVSIEETDEVATDVHGPPTAENQYYGPAGEKGPEETALAETLEKGGKGPGCRYFDKFGPTTGGPYPGCIFVHGGGQATDQWKEMETKGYPQHLGEDGIVVLNIDYRQASETKGAFGPAFDQSKDIQEAVEYMLANAAALKVDPNRIFILGGSGGGTLALLASEKINAAKPGTVKGVVAFSPYPDYHSFIKEIEEELYHEPKPTNSANNLIEHLQWALQQTLHKGAAGVPIVPGKPETNAAGSVTFQEEWSATKLTVPPTCKYLIMACTEDLIPANQPTLMKEHLEAQKRWDSRSALRLGTQAVKGSKEGHAFSLWGVRVDNPVGNSGKQYASEFIRAAESVLSPIIQEEDTVAAVFKQSALAGGGPQSGMLAASRGAYMGMTARLGRSNDY